MNNVIESKDIDIIKLSKKPSNVENIDDFDVFKNTLAINNISEPLKETEIRKYWDYFFFSKNGKELFSLKWEQNFIHFLNQFYNLQEDGEKQTLVDLNNLKLSIYVWDPSIVWQKEQEQIDKLSKDIDINTLIQTTGKLKATLEDQKQATRWQWRRFNFKWNTKEERELWKQYENQIDARLREIKKIEQNIQKLNEWWTEYEDVNDYRALNWLPQIASKLRELSNEVVDIDDALLSLSLWKLPESVYFDYKIRWKKSAEKLRDSMIKYNKELMAITTATHTAAGERLRQEDLIALQNYLTWVINGEIDPATQPFTAEQERAFKYLRTIDPTLQDTFDALPATWRKARKAQKAIVAWWNIWTGNVGNENTTGNVNTTWWWTTWGNNSPETQQISDQQEYKDRNEALAKWGTDWVVNYLTQWFQDKTPRGQQFYKTFSNVALIFGWVFLATKFIWSAWRIIRGKADANKNDRAWFLGTSGLLLATAGRPREIFKGWYASEQLARLFNFIWWWKKTDNSWMENLPQATVWVMSLFAGQKYSEIIDKVEKDSTTWKFKLRKSNYKTMVDQANAIINGDFTTEQKQNAQAQLSFLNSIWENDKFWAVDLAITTLIWEDELYKSENKDKPFDEAASNGLVRIAEFTTYMSSKNFEKTNPEMDESIKDFIRKWEPSLEELEAMGAFEKAVDNIPTEEQIRLRTMVDGLNIADENKKNQILQWVYQFYTDRPTDEATKKWLEIKNDGGRVSLETYGQNTRIDLGSKTMLWLNSSFFSSTKELLKAANLTNRIKEITKIQKDIPENPFRSISWWIKFNNSEWFEVRKLDDKVISSEGLQKVSPTLDKTKDQYIAYLNDRWKNKEKPDYIPDAAVITAAAAITTTEVDEDADEDLSWSGETAEQKAEREKKEIETLKTSLNTVIIALESKITGSSIEDSRKTALKNNLDTQKAVKEKENATKEDLDKAIEEVGKIEEELKKLEEEKKENLEKKQENKEKINKLLIPTLSKDVFNNERKEKHDVTYLTIQNPFLKISFDNPTYNSHPTGYGPSTMAATYDHYYSINLHQILNEDWSIDTFTLDNLVNEKKWEREKIMETNKIAFDCLQKIKEKEYIIDDLFKDYNAINHPWHVSFFGKFDDDILVFDKSDTKQKSDGSNELLLTFDDDRLNEDYNKNISIKLENITENGIFKEEKFKNELRNIINSIVEGNFKSY